MLLKSGDTSIIEYAAFCVSIQIFQYLLTNDAKYEHSIWLYGIHSNNPEIINLIESSQFNSPDFKFLVCLKEAIKCHNNNIADYIMNNFTVSVDDSEFGENVDAYGIHYHNYVFYPENLELSMDVNH